PGERLDRRRVGREGDGRRRRDVGAREARGRRRRRERGRHRRRGPAEGGGAALGLLGVGAGDLLELAGGRGPLAELLVAVGEVEEDVVDGDARGCTGGLGRPQALLEELAGAGRVAGGEGGLRLVAESLRGRRALRRRDRREAEEAEGAE